jgi:hypothetical protein
VRSIQPLVDGFAGTTTGRFPLPVASESVEVLVWAQVHETINPVTGLKQQVRKSLAGPEEAYIFGGRAGEAEVYRVLRSKTWRNKVNPKSRLCIQRHSGNVGVNRESSRNR